MHSKTDGLVVPIGSHIEVEALPAELYYWSADLQSEYPDVADILRRAACDIERCDVSSPPIRKLPEVISSLFAEAARQDETGSGDS